MVSPEAQQGGAIALVKDGDLITIDAVNNSIEVALSDDELQQRKNGWTAPPLKATVGALYKICAHSIFCLGRMRN